MIQIKPPVHLYVEAILKGQSDGRRRMRFIQKHIYDNAWMHFIWFKIWTQITCNFSLFPKCTRTHIHSGVTHRDASPYRVIATSTKRSRGGERNTVSLSHFTPFQLSGWTAVSLHSHRSPPLATTLPRYSSVANLSSLLLVARLAFQCWWGQMSVNTGFSDLQVKGCLVKAPGLKLHSKLQLVLKQT